MTIKTTPIDTLASSITTEGSTNRGNDIRSDSSELKPLYITLESINEIIIDYLTNKIQPSITENETRKPVPIIYGNPERWATIQKDGVLRDHQEKIQAPLIAIRRRAINRNKSMTNPMNKYVYIILENKWNSRNSYDRFAVQNGITPSRQFRTLVIPDYVDLTYEVIIWTGYQSQMDQIVEQINVEADEYWGDRNQHKFRVQIEEFISQSELPTQTDRVIRMAFDMKISAYIIPERMVKNFKLASTNLSQYSVKKIVEFGEDTSIVPKLK
jgi:hypothetical protein